MFRSQPPPDSSRASDRRETGEAALDRTQQYQASVATPVQSASLRSQSSPPVSGRSPVRQSQAAVQSASPRPQSSPPASGRSPVRQSQVAVQSASLRSQSSPPVSGRSPVRQSQAAVQSASPRSQSSPPASGRLFPPVPFSGNIYELDGTGPGVGQGATGSFVAHLAAVPAHTDICRRRKAPAGGVGRQEESEGSWSKDLNTLCVISAQSRTRSSDIALLRSLKQCSADREYTYTTSTVQHKHSTQKRNLGRTRPRLRTSYA